MIKYAPTPYPVAGRPPAAQEDIDYKRRMAMSLMQEGSSGAPVQHWTQALNRGLQGLSAGMYANQAADQSRDLAAFDEQKAVRQRMAERLAGMEDKKHLTEWERSLPPTALQQAQINKYNREAAEAGTAYGKNGTTVMGPDGNYYVVRYGADGTERINPLQLPGQQPTGGQPTSQPSGDGVGRFAAPAMGNTTPPPVQLTPSRGVDVVGDQMYDKATGAPIRNVGGNLAEAERQKGLGKGQAEGQLALPKAERALRSYEIKSENVNSLIDTATQQAGPWTTGFAGSLGAFVAGTPAHDLSKTLTAIQANLGFESLQDMRDNSPTGGALGNVTEMELQLLQSAWASVMQSQSEQQLKDNLARVKSIKAQFMEMKRRAYQEDVARFGAGNVPNPNDSGGGSAAEGGWTDVGGVRIREKR